MARQNKEDPTGQARTRKRATASLQKRLAMAERGVKAMFREVPKESHRQTKIVNADDQLIYYDYDYPKDAQINLAANVQALLDRTLEVTTDDMPQGWYMQENIEQPYRQGTLETVNSMNQMISAAAIAGVSVRGVAPSQIQPEQILLTIEYQQRLDTAYVSSYQTIKGLSNETSAQVMRQINDGIKAKQSPSVIAAKITERFDVAKSKAQRIASTEINKAYNDAKLDANNVIANATGLRAGVIHISALLPTTREGHAARHGNAYTVEQQRQWWDEGANRINCHCSTISVLIDRNGKVIQAETQEEIKAEKAFFD